MPTPPYGRATAPWVRFCHILHSTHHSARSRRTRAVSDSTASSGRNSASSRSPALVLGCPFLSFSSTFRSRHQSLYLSSMVGYSNPEIQICKSAKDTRGCTLIVFFSDPKILGKPNFSTNFTPQIGGESKIQIQIGGTARNGLIRILS